MVVEIVSPSYSYKHSILAYTVCDQYISGRMNGVQNGFNQKILEVLHIQDLEAQLKKRTAQKSTIALFRA